MDTLLKTSRTFKILGSIVFLNLLSFGLFAQNYSGGNGVGYYDYTFSGASITSQIIEDASNVSICEGNNAFFEIKASGMSALYYQWQINNGSGWQDISGDDVFIGVNTSRLELLSVVNTYNLAEFRCYVSNSFGGDTSLPVVLTVVNIDADFSYTVDGSRNTTFTSTSAGGSEWYWTFDDGGFSSSESPSHQYDADGNYNVCLTIYNSTSKCQSQFCKDVLIGVNVCRAGYTYSVTAAQNKVNYLDATVGGVNSWYWNFGDGTTSTQQNPAHVYSKAGLYKTTLSTMNTATGCSGYYSEEIEVGDAECIADFTYFVNSSTNTVVLNNRVKGNISSYYWEFDDGNISTDFSPEHIYLIAGKYEVCLTVKGASGMCMDKQCQEIQVGIVDCNASFTAFIDSANNSVKFSNKVLGESTNLYWEFGDGGVSTENNPEYSYSSSGYYYVSLNTFDASGSCMDYYSEIILVGEIGKDCEASFIYQINSDDKYVSFFNESVGKDVSIYLWDLGDGNVLCNENPEYEYEEDGYYNVCLTIFDTLNDCQNTSCEYIEIKGTTPTCLANFIYTTDSATGTVSFKDKSFGIPDLYSWSFGDSTTSKLQNPNHIFSEAGYYSVELHVENSSTGEESFFVDLINVSKGNQGLKGTFGFVWDSLGSRKGVYPTDFIGASFGEPASFSWSFGDGGTNTTTLSPSHDYSGPGTYSVCFSISDPVINKSHSFCDDILIGKANSIIENKLSEKKSVSFKCYPNPSNDITFIEMQLIKKEQLKVEIYDIIGNKVAQLHNGILNKGVHKLLFNSTNLKDGIYFIKVSTSNSFINKKLVVVGK